MSTRAPSLRPTRFGQSLSIQARIVGALLMREILTRFGRHNVGFMWLFLEPMLFTLGVTALWLASKPVHGSTLPIVAFAITGYSSVLLWRNCASRCVNAVGPNQSLLYHRNVRVIDFFLARILLEISGATLSFVALMLLFGFIGWIAAPADLMTLTAGWLLLAWFGAALGLAVGAFAERNELIDRLWHTVSYLLFPLSGAATMVDWLPRAAQEVMLYLPMVHGVEMLRHGYYGDLVQTYEDPTYLALCNAVLTLIGLTMVLDVGRRTEPQ